MLEISPLAKISPMTDIEDSVKGSIIRVGEGTVIDSFVKVKPAGGEGDLIIGKNCSINSGTVIYIGNGVQMADNVAIGANSVIAPTNHQYHAKDVLIRDQRFMASRGGVVIEEDVWIGAGVILLDGAVLRKGCVVGAGSLVRGELPPYSVNYGSPAKTVCYRD